MPDFLGYYPLPSNDARLVWHDYPINGFVAGVMSENLYAGTYASITAGADTLRDRKVEEEASPVSNCRASFRIGCPMAMLVTQMNSIAVLCHQHNTSNEHLCRYIANTEKQLWRRLEHLGPKWRSGWRLKCLQGAQGSTQRNSGAP